MSTTTLSNLTGFQRDLLVTIQGLGEEPSGKEILAEVQELYENEITGGRHYPNLDTLVNKDLVEKGQLDKRTNYYSLTSKGEQKLEDYAEFVGDSE